MNKAICLVMCLAMAVSGIYGYIDNHTEKTYQANARVTATYDSDPIHKVSVVDEEGEGWVFYGEGYEVGQAVKLTMHNNCTPNRYDDTILRAVTL